MDEIEYTLMERLSRATQEVNPWVEPIDNRVAPRHDAYGSFLVDMTMLELEYVALCIVRNRTSLLLIHEITSRGDRWILPGGHVEQHETIGNATLREVSEETNALLRSLSALAYIVRLYNPSMNRLSVAFVHRAQVSSPICTRASPLMSGPKQSGVAFYTDREAINLIATNNAPPEREPLLHYLTKNQEESLCTWNYLSTEQGLHLVRKQPLQ